MDTRDDKVLYSLYERLVELPVERREQELASTALAPEALRKLRGWLDAFDQATSSLSGAPLVSLSHDDLERAFGDSDRPDIVGPYRLLERLPTEGGMGTVYRAERADGTYRQAVAIKVIRRGLDTDRLLARFSAERQILARLNHPSIVTLLDAGALADGRPFFVMELVEGGVALDEFCVARTLGLAERLELFLKVCGAVEHAHRHLVVHRDLKPANVLVTPDGEPKLLDFGVAKLLAADGESASTGVTQPGERFLTPEYASPEQIRGEAVLPASDVYALGVMLFELLTGKRPYAFASRSPAEIERIVCEVPAPRSSALEGDLDAIVAKALRKDIDNRYGTVDELARDIQNYRAGLPVLAHAGSTAYRARKFVRRNRVYIATAAAVFLALTAGTAVATWQAVLASRARDEANAQRAVAQARFDDVRRIATNFVFEFHDAIEDLPGGTPARQMVVQKGLEYLDILAKDAGTNVPLQLELAEAYDRIGDVQSNPFGSNLGNVQAGLASYERATAIRAPLVATAPVGGVLDLAYTKGLERRADGLFANGRVADGVTLFEQATARYEVMLNRDPRQLDARRGLARSLGRSCALSLALGDAARALEACRKGRVAFDDLLAEPGAADTTFRRTAALHYSAFGNALRLTGKPEEAAPVQRLAVERMRAIVSEEPTNGTARQNLATILAQYAATEMSLKNLSGAATAYEEAIEAIATLYRADPANERLRAVLSFALGRYSNVLLRMNRIGDARLATSRGLSLLKAQADRPQASPTDKNEFASALLNAEPADLRRPAEALRFALEAVAASPTPVFLDTLALAYFGTSQTALAIATAEKAVASLPPLKAGEISTGLRAEIEGHLALFRKAAAAKAGASGR